MRDVILFAIILTSLPLSFLKPHVGIYFWYWITFMNPHRFTYGFMYSFPVALLSGTATLAIDVSTGSMSDRLVVMHEGRVTGELFREQATPERVMELATGGQ